VGGACTEDVGHGIELAAKERAVGVGQRLDQPLHAHVGRDRSA
jgi:hypothetical protein